MKAVGKVVRDLLQSVAAPAKIDYLDAEGAGASVLADFPWAKYEVAGSGCAGRAQLRALEEVRARKLV